MPRGVENKEPEKKPVEEPTVLKTSAPEVHWTVPEKTKFVYLTKLDKNGRRVKSYTITDFISMKPGETFVITVK